MGSDSIVYAVVLDASGHVLGRRFVVAERLSEWLLRYTGDAARCELYSRLPTNRRTQLRTLLRQGLTWSEEPR